jgi:hypothetical protein
MSDRSLVILLDEVRGKTLRLLEGVGEEEARWTPPGLKNHILWHSGHSYLLVEWLSMRAIRQDPRIPEQWFEFFSWESDPAQIPPDWWPPLERVASELKLQHMRVRHTIEGLSAERLSEPDPHHPNHTIRFAILHGLHDEACHTGEIWLLRKLYRQGRKG